MDAGIRPAVGYARPLRDRADRPNPLPQSGGPARVSFTLGRDASGPTPASVRVHDLFGRTVRGLWSGTLARGVMETATWDGRDDHGNRVRAGLYWIAVGDDGDVAAVRVVAL